MQRPHDLTLAALQAVKQHMKLCLKERESFDVFRLKLSLILPRLLRISLCLLEIALQLSPTQADRELWRLMLLNDMAWSLQH